MNAWPRQPFVGLTLAAVVGIALADRWPNCSFWPIALTLALAVLALLARRSLGVYALVTAAFFYIHSVAHTNSAGQKLAQQLGGSVTVVTVEGMVLSEPKIAPNGFASFVFALSSIETDGASRPCNARVFARWKGTPQFGDDLKLFGTIQPIPPPRNPGEFDMRAYLARQDLRDELVARYAENGQIVRHTGGNRLLQAAQTSRRWMQHVLARGLEDSPAVSGLVEGMVLGLRHQTPEDIEEPFQQTGTLHLFAVAGLHVGIVAQLLWTLATVARIPRKWATALIIPALLFYATVTGLHTSSVRAALMASVLLGGYFVERRVFALNSLAAAAMLILCWDTNELFAVGFQLSFAVVGTIILLSDPVFRILRRSCAGDPFLPRSLFGPGRRTLDKLLWWLTRAAAVSFAAWIGSLPLMLRYYHLITPISLLANLLVIPIAYCVLAGGLLSLLAAPITTWLSLVFNNANWAAAQLILGIVHLFAHVPDGHLYVEDLHWPDGARAEINVLDTGTGAAVHVRSGGHDWLFDSGGRRDYERFVRDYLRSRGVNRLDGLLLSHGDAAHIGGAAGVLLDFKPRLTVDSPAHDRSRAHASFTATLAQQHMAPKLCSAGDELMIGGHVTARVLFPPRDFVGDAADDQALVLQLFIDGRPRVLFTSDSGQEAEAVILASGVDLHADVLIKGQHHSGTVPSSQFLEAVRPQVIVATSRDFPPWEQVSDDWAAFVERHHVKLFRQDQSGAVRLRFFRDHYQADPFLAGDTFRSSNR
ncbi:MAG: ComEC/Rec2 family competence protein [Chthoniobacterales bacterium]|nr:ComEC/Rec2 family competence protein [Chthoniobacterales bacterium]